MSSNQPIILMYSIKWLNQNLKTKGRIKKKKIFRKTFPVEGFVNKSLKIEKSLKAMKIIKRKM